MIIFTQCIHAQPHETSVSIDNLNGDITTRLNDINLLMAKRNAKSIISENDSDKIDYINSSELSEAEKNQFIDIVTDLDIRN